MPLCTLLTLCLSIQQASPTPADLFPPAKEGIVITADGDPQKSQTLTELLDEFSRVTGVTLQMTRETQAVVRASRLGLNRSITIPASEVHRIVETLLIANDFVFLRVSNQEPRIWIVQSLASGGSRGGPAIRNDAQIVDEKDLGVWMHHPATLVTTVIDLPHTDVRTLSNSMRTMFTDANTQQIIPVGESSLIITGFAPSVSAIARILHLVDDRSRLSGGPKEPSVQRKPGEAK